MRKGTLTAAMAMSVMGGMGTAAVVGDVNQLKPVSERQAKAADANKTTKAKVKKRQMQAAATPNGYYGTYFLMPHNKESFKQSRRKQLKKRAYRKAKRNGQV